MTAILVEELAAELRPELAALSAAVEAEIGPQPDTTTMVPAEGRALSAKLNQRWNRDLPAMAHASEVTVAAEPALGSADCSMLVLIPPDAADGLLFFVHGGGFAYGSPRTHERFARLLALETGLPVAVPDYRLAPEHPYPAGLNDVIACLHRAFEVTAPLGIRQGPLLVAGDSAGANLALAAMLHDREEGRTLPEGALLFYGVYDADFETPSYRRFRDGPGLTQGKMRRYWDWYLSDLKGRASILASPLRANEEALRALPPLFLMAAEIDPLLSDTLNFAARLKEAGRHEEVHLVTGVTHGFLQLTLGLQAARDAVGVIGEAARRMIVKA